MVKSVWLNLPVKRIKASKTFVKAIGFRENPMHRNASHLGSFLIGENDFVLMLFPREAFKTFMGNEISDTEKGTEVLINIDAASKREVDEMAEKGFIRQGAKSMLSLVIAKVGCTPSDSWILTDIDGACCTWIWKKCLRNKVKELNN